MENTKPQTVYAGDEHPDRLNDEQVTLTLAALNAAKAQGSLRPMTLKQVNEAMKDISVPKFPGYLEPVSSAKLVAALIVAEDDVHGEDKSDLLLNAVRQGLERALRACGYRLLYNRGICRKWLAIDIWVVALRDNLSDYTLANGLLDKIESIRTVRFFDRNQVTYACSMSGAHYLEYLDMQVTLKPEFADDDYLRSEAYDAVTEANGAEINDAKLYDQRYVEDIISQNIAGTVYHSGNPGLDLDEALEGAKNELSHSIRSNRINENYGRKQRGESELPVDTITINGLVEEHFKDADTADEEMHRYIMNAVREGLQANTVL